MDWAGFASIGGVFFACALSYRCGLEQGRHCRGHSTHRQSAGVTPWRWWPWMTGRGSTRKVAWPDLGFVKKPLLPATSKIGWTIRTCVFFVSKYFFTWKLFFLDPSLLTFSCRVPAVCPQPGSSWKYGRRFCAQWTMASAAAAERLQGLRCWVVQGKRPMGSTRAWLKVADLQSVWKCVFKYW